MPVDPNYSTAAAGSLKLKGLGQTKKKKKSSSSKSKKELSRKGEEAHLSKGKERLEERENVGENNPAQASSSGPAMTEAERRFEETRRRRMAEKVAKEAKLSHKERVDQFNNHLANLTEHFDLPKVGPG